MLIKKGVKCAKRDTEDVATAKAGSIFHKLGVERTQGGISRGGGEREMFHGAVMPTERALNVFNIT